LLQAAGVRKASVESSRRDIFLRIEPLDRYSPLAPVTCARRYGRDCMFNEGHELGRVSPQEIAVATVNALVYREYLDPEYTVPNTAKLIPADVNEPPWNRRVPGALIWAHPGERLYIHVLNGDADACHSFHVHGVKYGIDSDGAWPFGIPASDGRRSDEIRPGERWTYVFDATEETIGAWPFHDHAHNVATMVNRGLFGALIVRDPASACPEHEVPVFMHQMVGTGIECSFLSNTLTPGDQFQFTFGTEEGACRYHCQIHGPTMWGEVQVSASAPPLGPAPQIRAIDNQWKPQILQVPAGSTVTWRNDETEANHDHIVVSDGGGASTFCLNGRAFVGNTPTIVADSGQHLRWYLFNLDLGGVWHNFHPHSARWRLPKPPGGAGDVHSLSPVESFVTDTEVPRALRLPCELEELQCEPPETACRLRVRGDFLFHCHIEEHMMRGLAGLVRAREWVWLTEEALKTLPIRLPLDDRANECPVVDIYRCQPRKPPIKDGDPPQPPKEHKPEHHPSPHVMPAPAMPMGPMSGMGGMTASPLDLSEAATRGMWELLPCDSQVLAVHAALMHTGRILFFAGSGNDELYTTGLRSIVWDYEQGAFHQPFTPTDFFCAGQSFLAEGRLFVAGGTKDYGFTGLPDGYLFDPASEEWIRVQDMAEGRWYPTCVTLGDGRILVVSGGPNRDEIYSSVTGWTRQQTGQGWPAVPASIPVEERPALLQRRPSRRQRRRQPRDPQPRESGRGSRRRHGPGDVRSESSRPGRECAPAAGAGAEGDDPRWRRSSDQSRTRDRSERDAQEVCRDRQPARGSHACERRHPPRPHGRRDRRQRRGRGSDRSRAARGDLRRSFRELDARRQGVGSAPLPLRRTAAAGRARDYGRLESASPR
jgi:FtsP/CotA-like multicopper oxidase with cupredoxin domain